MSSQGSPVQFIAVQDGAESGEGGWLKISAWVLGIEASSLRDASGSSTKTTVESASLSVALGSMTVVCKHAFDGAHGARIEDVAVAMAIFDEELFGAGSGGERGVFEQNGGCDFAGVARVGNVYGPACGSGNGSDCVEGASAGGDEGRGDALVGEGGWRRCRRRSLCRCCRGRVPSADDW